MSALLGRIPSAVGYQPTLATDMGTMQERITTTKKGSITSVQVRRIKWTKVLVGGKESRKIGLERQVIKNTCSSPKAWL